MKTKAIASLLAACMILLAGCGGSDTPAPASAPSGGADTPPAQNDVSSSENAFCGVWNYPENNVRLQLFDDETWEMLDENDEVLAGGTITMNGDTAELYYTYNSPWDNGAMYASLHRSAQGELSDGMGGSLYLTDAVPVSHGVVRAGASAAQDAAQGDIGPFVGLWEYTGVNLWLNIYDNGTFEVFDGLGHALYDGTVTMNGSTAVLDNEYHNFQQQLEHNADGSLKGSEPGDLFVAVDSLPDSIYSLSDYAGYWKYAESELWLAVREDATWELVNASGDTVYDGACKVVSNQLVLYYGTGDYFMSLEISPTDCLFSDELDEVLWPTSELPGR